MKLSWRTPEQVPLLGEDTRKNWTRTPPPEPVKPSQKVGPVAPSTPRQPLRQRVGSWSQVAASSDPWGQIWKMREMTARIGARMNAGESYDTAREAVRRELWPDEFRGQD